jgi:hypothetical protein
VVSNTRRSRKQEHRIAGEVGGRPVSGSGSGWVTKNDVKTDKWSIEVKFTDKKSYSLKIDDLLKAEKYALMDGMRDMAFIVELGGREWVIVARELAHQKGLFADGD